MPEGPSLVILRELTRSFAGKRILRAEGNSKIDLQRLVGTDRRTFYCRRCQVRYGGKA